MLYVIVGEREKGISEWGDKIKNVPCLSGTKRETIVAP